MSFFALVQCDTGLTMQVKFISVITCTVLVSLLLVRISQAQGDLMDDCPACCFRNETYLAKVVGNCMDSEETIVKEGRCLSFCVKSVSLNRVCNYIANT